MSAVARLLPRLEQKALAAENLIAALRNEVFPHRISINYR